MIIVSNKILLKSKIKKETRKSFLQLLEKETTKDLFKQILAINIVILFLSSTMSNKACYRLLKEQLIDRSNQIQKKKEKI